jgi:hypothetical protein
MALCGFNSTLWCLNAYWRFPPAGREIGSKHSEEARQFRAVALLLMWSLSSPQQPLETEAFSNRLIVADYSRCWQEMQSGIASTKSHSKWESLPHFKIPDQIGSSYLQWSAVNPARNCKSPKASCSTELGNNSRGRLQQEKDRPGGEPSRSLGETDLNSVP